MPSREASRRGLAREIDALCCDYDRTLTDLDLRVVEEALDALRRARDAGKKVVIVSGRDMPFLVRELGDVADAIVGENGCFLLRPGGEAKRLGPAADIHGALACLDIELERGQVLASAPVEHTELLRATLAKAGIDADLIPNRDRVMVLPRGVDKALGVLAALESLGVDPARAAAVGDGENDLPLLSAVGYGIAVANAVDELKVIADHVSEEIGGHGVASWICDRWLVEVRA